MQRSFKTVRGFAALLGLAFAILPGASVPAIAQQILPEGLTQFTDGNGSPLAAGSVAFYIPNTLTGKTTWSDSALTVPNSNPVALDANGRAPIWGKGSYRQVVKDVNGNQIWDRVTSAADWTNIAITGGTISGVSITGSTLSGSSLTVNSVANSALAQAPANTVKGNITGTTANVTDNTLTAVVDADISNVQGSVLYRGATAWSALGPGTSGQYLQTAGTAANPAWATIPHEIISTTQVFSTSGTFTVPTGIDKIRVLVVGGGGSGSYGGGGGGGAAIKTITGLTPGATITVTVGGTGGTSSFGSYASATGGGNGANAYGGAGGGATGGDVNIGGQGGDGGCSACASGVSWYGAGGSSIIGGGGTGGVNGGGAAPNPSSYGGGGGGYGGVGYQGVVIVEY